MDCCRTPQLILKREEPLADGKKRKVYLCENCRAEHIVRNSCTISTSACAKYPH
jgi:hypothetical protein